MPGPRAQGRRSVLLLLLLAGVVALVVVAKGSGTAPPAHAPSKTAPRASTPAPKALTREEIAFLDTLERHTFQWFWDLSDSTTGLTPDRAPTKSFVSVSATGFALTAYPIGVERRWVSRSAARDRVLATLRFFLDARQDTAAAGVTGYHGFFYHFLDPATGTRFETVELSTVDTALLLAGVLFCQSYFDHADPKEAEVRAAAESLYARADWPWTQVRPHRISHGWDPEKGFLPWDWGGFNESMIVPILALGSPSRPADPEVYAVWARGCTWGTFEGREHVGFPPLFGHQYSQVWLDLRGVRDSLMRARHIDWFENSRRATLAQRDYAIHNPAGFRGYGARLWGLSACDGPLDATLEIEGKKREFHTYAARGASYREVNDDGTVAPTAAGGSIAFAPEVVIPTLMAMREDWGDRAFNRYGFVDALNPTLRTEATVHHGRVIGGVGWSDVDQLGIDQGPILAMAENLRTGLVWRVMRKNRHVVRGLKRAGFRGGWLDSVTTR
jgi:hypothetical protein